MSQQEVIKSVSKRLKYYFEVKRLEDGFDLSGPDCPRLDHPPMKARPTLMYDGLHDRPLKHYFSPYEVRVALTHFKPTKKPKPKPEGKEGKAKQVKKMMERYMRRYTYLEKNDSTEKENPTLSDAYYTYHRQGGRTLRPEAGGGFGTPMRRRKPAHRGGYPVLRTRPPQYVSRGETQRLVNMASKMLIATETIDLKKDDKEDDKDSEQKAQREEEPHRHSKSSRASRSSSASRRQSAPRPFESETKRGFPEVANKQRAKSAKARQGSRQSRRAMADSEAEEDSAYSTPHNRTSPHTIDGDQADEEAVPSWLRTEMKKTDVSEDEDSQSQWVRPLSGHTDPRPPQRGSSHRTGRPMAAKYRHRPRPDELPLNAKRSDWSSGSSVSDNEGQRNSRSNNDGESTERVVEGGEKVRYKIHVFTGSCLGASTKADVHIRLCGDKGSTRDVFLKKSKTSKVLFQKGQEDVFEIEPFYVGPVRKIVIGHDRKEMGYGWFLDRVLVKDTRRQLRYDVPCESWLSSNDGDGSTVRTFNVQTSSSYLQDRDRESSEPPTYVAESQPKPPEPQYVNVQNDKTDSEREDKESLVGSIHTSVQSVAGDMYGEGDTKGSVSASSYTESETETEEETETATQSNSNTVLSPRSPTIQRRDDFFDQKVKDKDYSSVIESLGTEQDNKDDFESDKPQYSSRDRPGTATLTLMSRPLEERSETGSYSTDTAVLTARDVEEAEKQEEFMDGFKAGLEAARRSSSSSSNNNQQPQEPQKPTTASPKDAGPESGGTVHHAAKVGDLKRIKDLVARNPDLKTAPDEKGWCLLHIAAANGQLEVLQWLSINVIDLDVDTPTGYTAMHLAAMHGHTNCMMVLAAMGARVGVKSIEEQTPLHLGAMSGHVESVKWLVANRCNVQLCDSNGRTAREVAHQYQHSEIESFLKSCEDELDNPHSGFSLMRSSTVNSVDSVGKKDKAESDSWQNDQQRTTTPRQDSTAADDSEDELDRFVKKKHDQELMEKRKVYQDQQKKMETKHTSFLDSIRADYDDEFY